MALKGNDNGNSINKPRRAAVVGGAALLIFLCCCCALLFSPQDTTVAGRDAVGVHADENNNNSATGDTSDSTDATATGDTNTSYESMVSQHRELEWQLGNQTYRRCIFGPRHPNYSGRPRSHIVAERGSRRRAASIAHSESWIADPISSQIVNWKLRDFCRRQRDANVARHLRHDAKDADDAPGFLVPEWSPHQFLDWGAFGHQLLCIRGRDIFVRYAGMPSMYDTPRTRGSSSNASSDETVETSSPSTTAAPLPASRGKKRPRGAVNKATSSTAASGNKILRMQRMRWQQNRVIVKLLDIDDADHHFFNYSGKVTLHSGVGVIASVYFQAFHVLMNTLLPMYHVLEQHVVRASRRMLDDMISATGKKEEEEDHAQHTSSPLAEDAVSSSSELAAPPQLFLLDPATPPVDVTLYREIPVRHKKQLIGGEDFSIEMVSAIGSESSKIVQVVERLQPAANSTTLQTDTPPQDQDTHCYCSGVLHNMLDLLTLQPHQSLAVGDPARRKATRYIKYDMNERYGFLPYGTYPIPTSEYAPFGLWTSPLPPIVSPTAEGAAAAPPRLLLILRTSTRVLGDAEAIEQMAQRVGFHVHVMVAERFSIALQARAARYADVIMAVHGQALTWLVMMDGTRASHCREVVELQFFGKPLQGFHNCYEVMAADSYLRYTRVAPTAVQFLNRCRGGNGDCSEWRSLMLTTNFPQVHEAFHKQKVFFRHTDRLYRRLQAVYERVSTCIVANTPVTLPLWYVLRSERATSKFRSAKKKK